MMKKKYRYVLSIAGILLLMETEQCLALEDSFLPFLTEAATPDIRAFFERINQLPEIPEAVIHKDFFYSVHPDVKGQYLYSYFDAPKDDNPYAVVSYNDSRDIIQVNYLEKGSHCVSEMRNSFVHLNFERILIRRKRIYFHAACIQTHLGGILFSGKSGIGKTTQAELWGKHRNSRQINGDRPILSRDENGWLAWGSPYAGSSRYHVNESCSVTAIVMLRQAKTCELRQMNLSEAFRAVWSGFTVHGWDSEYMEAASDLALDLINMVPVFEFSCTPDVQAVDYLEQGLRKECGL